MAAEYEIVTLKEMWDRLAAMTKRERDEWAVGLSSAIWCQLGCTIPLVSTMPRVVVLEHGPKGCLANYETFHLTYLGQQWGQPTHIPKCSTGVNESEVVLGAEGKLEEAILAVDKKYHPELICVLSCCVSGIMGEDISGVVDRMRPQCQADVLYIESPGFRNTTMGESLDVVIQSMATLIEPPRQKIKDSVNLLGLYKDTYAPPGVSNSPTDITEYGRYIEALGLKINSIIWGSVGGVGHIKRAAQAEFNVGTCVTYHLIWAKIMEEKFGIPYSPHGQALGVEINRKWIMAVAEHFGREERGEEFFNRELEIIRDDFERAKELCSGKVGLLDGGRNTGSAVARTLMHARFAEELGLDPIIFNVHPLELFVKAHDVEYFLGEGVNPKVVWYPYPFGKAVNPTLLMEMMNLEPKDAMYIHSDVFHYAVATGLPFEATGTFDASIIPKVNASSHVRRCRSGPHRTYGLRGTHRLLKELLDGAKATRGGLYPSFEARLGRAAARG